MKCLNTRAKLIIQQLYEAMFHEPYMLTEGSYAKINNTPAFMPVVIEKVENFRATEKSSASPIKESKAVT